MANTVPPIPTEPIGETHQWREWFKSVRASGFTGGGGLAGVTYFNTRVGSVLLTAADVAAATGVLTTDVDVKRNKSNRVLTWLSM